VEGEGFEALRTRMLDICNKIIKVEVKQLDLNYVRRLGLASKKIRPVIVSFVSYMKKVDVLRNSRNLLNTGIFVSHDCNEETRQKRNEVLKIRANLRKSGQNSQIRGMGLLIDGKYFGHKELIEMYSIESEGEDMTETTGQTKKRRRTTKDTQGPSAGGIAEFFRPRSDSSASSTSIKK
jgi:hypothetical protein